MHNCVHSSIWISVVLKSAQEREEAVCQQVKVPTI